MKLFETDMDGEFKRRESNKTQKNFVSRNLNEGMVLPHRRNSYEYNALIWERWALRDESDSKMEMDYALSLKSIKEDGFSRFPTPKEAFTVAMQYYDGTLGNERTIRLIVEDMIKGDPEFFCYAMTKHYNHLIFYEDVYNLDFNGDYKANNAIWNRGEQMFDIHSLEGGEFYNLKEIDDVDNKILPYLYGKSYDEIPSSVRYYEPTIYIPEEGELLIAGRGSDVFGVHGYHTAASRGVKEK